MCPISTTITAMHSASSKGAQMAVPLSDLLKQNGLEDLQPKSPTSILTASLFSSGTSSGSRSSLEVVEEHAELEGAQGPSYPGTLPERVRLLFADSSSMDCYTGKGSSQHGASGTSMRGHRGPRTQGARHSIDVASMGCAGAAGTPRAHEVTAHAGAGKNSEERALPRGHCVGLTFTRSSRSMDVGRAVPGSPAGHPGLAGQASSEHCVQRSLLDDMMAPTMGQTTSQALTESAKHDSSIMG